MWTLIDRADGRTEIVDNLGIMATHEEASDFMRQVWLFYDQISPEEIAIYNQKTRMLIDERLHPVRDRFVFRGTKAGFVYILRVYEQPDLYKIGMTTNLPQRMKSLSYLGTDLVFTIETEDPRTVERRIHQDYAQYWEHGEWFRLSDEILDNLIKSLGGSKER